MRKFVTFLIVLIIQIAIIYGLYKWYVGHESSSSTVQPSSNVENSAVSSLETGKAGVTKGVNSAKAKAPGASQPEKNTVKNASQRNMSGGSKSATSENALSYKGAVWGDIPSLTRSNQAKTGILVDLDKREVIWAKHSRKSVPIASMTKMMTVLLTLEYVDDKNNEVTLDTIIPVTNEAYKIGGTQVYLDPREKFPLKELLKTILISSANDSAYLVGQYLGGGDVNTFVGKMNKRAKELNMPNAHFSNPDGLPEKYSSDDNKATAEGLVFLAEQLLKYPLVREFATTSLDYFRKGSKNPMMLVNTNRLVRSKFNGITGLKTGYIRRSGFCLTATCERDGRRLVAVATGFKDSKKRDKFVGNLLNWGYKKLATKS